MRHGRLIVFITLVAILGALFATSALRPIYTATALLVVEPASDNLLASGSGPLAETPNNGAIDGMVEIMRSDPVMRRAMELVAPFELADFSSGLDLQPMFLGFFGSMPRLLQMERRGGRRCSGSCAIRFRSTAVA